MNRNTKIWLIAAACLVLIGCITFIGVTAADEWNYGNSYELNSYEINEDFSNITIKSDTADIMFMPSADGKIKVDCYEGKKVKHLVAVDNGTLSVSVIDSREWYEYISIGFASPKITVYLPEGEYETLFIKESTGDIELAKGFSFKKIDLNLSTGDVKCYSDAEDIKIAASTGDIQIKDIRAKTLNLSVSTGKVTVVNTTVEGDVIIGASTGKTYVTNLSCKNLTSTADTGDIILRSVIAAEKFFIERSTGDVELDGSDAKEIFIETSTGDVEGSLLTPKVFITKTDTGDIDVPRSVADGGTCEITTSTGDIEITVKSSK